jgi:hypothetical protein
MHNPTFFPSCYVHVASSRNRLGLFICRCSFNPIDAASLLSAGEDVAQALRLNQRLSAESCSGADARAPSSTQPKQLSRLTFQVVVALLQTYATMLCLECLCELNVRHKNTSGLQEWSSKARRGQALHPQRHSGT